MLTAFLGVLIAMALVMGVAWWVQRALADGGWTDVFWTYGTGLTCAAAALWPAGDAGGSRARQLIVAAIVLLWALRLGTYVARRVARGPEDSRYAVLRRDWGARFQSRMLGFLLAQAPATALLSISVRLAARASGPRLRLADGMAALLMIVCIAGETLADRQMRRFKASRPAHGEVCRCGLWRWSRHPNYFFEFLLWVAWPVMAIRPADAVSWLALIGPLTMFCLLRFVTGVPPLEAAMLRSKGDAYRRYQLEVNALVPGPRRDAAA